MGLESLITAVTDGSVVTDHETCRDWMADWWALSWLRKLRQETESPPDAVILPGSERDVAAVLAWAEEHRTPVVTRGGGSGVVGGAVPRAGEILVDMSRLDRIIELDPVSMTVSAQAGIRGDRLEAVLRDEGLTLGHYPQSLALSTVGGWIASSAIGHASLGYGAIEDMVLGLTAVLAGGRTLRLRSVPRTAAGPDLRRLFVGSEGTLGIITEATLSLHRSPVGYEWVAYQTSDFKRACDLARSIAQARIPALILRAYDRADSAFTFGPLGFEGESLLILALDQGLPGLDESLDELNKRASEAGATPLPPAYGRHWHEHHTDAIDLYRKIMGPERIFGSGVLVDTMEVAGLWGSLAALYGAVGGVLSRYAETTGCHLSHAYRSGASLYFTFLLRSVDDVRLEELYSACWQEAVDACHATKGTMTHHHGVGVLRAPYMAEELGPDALQVLRALKRSVDRQGIMNPRKLIPDV